MLFCVNKKLGNASIFIEFRSKCKLKRKCKESDNYSYLCLTKVGMNRQTLKTLFNISFHENLFRGYIVVTHEHRDTVKLVDSGVICFVYNLRFQ
jgi:hypothetical protein